MIRYFVGAVGSFLIIVISVVVFAWYWSGEITALTQDITAGRRQSPTFLALSVPLGTLLPIIFGFVKTMDVCLERINNHLVTKSKLKLLENIREKTEHATLYAIQPNDWQYMYDLKRDGFVEVRHTREGWVAQRR